MKYEWIPVGQRLPPDQGMVLVAVSDYARPMAAYCGTDRQWRWSVTGSRMEGRQPTHWMPMPPLPWEGGAEDSQGPQPAIDHLSATQAVRALESLRRDCEAPSRWLPEPGPTTPAEAKEAWALSEARARRPVEDAKNRVMKAVVDAMTVAHADPEPAPAAYSREFTRGVQHGLARPDPRLDDIARALGRLEARIAVLEARG